ncbi:hypothetical protein B0H17DRAFT_1138929 [Mycena rosella]|uniref:Uncharacterized protein n=1 Tax=Mycena rosella TaxID=1033263 RepID=A0AAD7D6V5_MYCRO|nr:hypothetical protein B0H17DRAFT_1138929 [Mycena rosella]
MDSPGALATHPPRAEHNYTMLQCIHLVRENSGRVPLRYYNKPAAKLPRLFKYLLSLIYPFFYKTCPLPGGTVEITVAGAPPDGTGLNGRPPAWAARWEDQVMRAAQGGGRVEVHLMVAPISTSFYSFVVPLRGGSGRQDAARRRFIDFVGGREGDPQDPGDAHLLAETRVLFRSAALV